MSYRRPNIEYFISDENVCDRRISEVLALLREQPQLRTAQLAPMVELGTSRLRHLFKEQVGVNIGTYAKKIQLHRSAELLTTTHRSVKEIRNEIGIPDAPNFVRHFKEWSGMSPSAYRNSKKARLTNKKPD